MADRNWENISIDTMLNFEGPQTAEIARFDRILRHRTIEATNGLSTTIYRASQLAQEKADEAIKKAGEAAVAQGKQQTAMKWLTIALVACTAMYTGINAWVAHEMHEENKIQAQVADAAKEQARAAREANDIQRKSLHVPGDREK
jgi:hypothetical protein